MNRFIDWYFSKKALPYWCVLAIDCAIVLFSGYISAYFQFGGSYIAGNFWGFTCGNCCVLLFFVVFFRVFHTYTGYVRYSSYQDLYRVVFSNLCATGLAALVFVLLPFEKTDWGQDFQVLRFFLTLCGLSTALIWLEKIVVKSLFELANAEKAIPVAIYGTQAGGVSLANSISGSTTKEYSLKCFVSDLEEMKDAYLLGKPVFLKDAGIVGRLTDCGVKKLLVSPLKSKEFRKDSELIDGLIQAGIRIMMMPSAKEWDGKSNLTHQHLHDVMIEDLLPRETIDVDMDAIAEMLTGKSVLITGAAGSIGSEMARQVASFKPSALVLVDQAETPMHDVRMYMAANHKDQNIRTIVGSITNCGQMESIFNEFRPEYVFHAAAYKHVPMMEDNPAMAVQNNVFGTRVIADLAVKYGTKKFVMISTDKAVNPTNVMGCSKRICEIYCQSLNSAIVSGEVKGVTQFVTTRFGNVLGSNGSVIPIFREQIKNGGPVLVTHPDIIRFFMLISEACKLVLEAGTMGKGGEIFVFDMGAPVKIVNLARRMIKLSGAKDVEIRFTGLRDGEKLYEEVLSEAETTCPTVHPKIRVASVREYPYSLALANEKELLEISRSFDDMRIVRKMKEIVPEFKSACSKYETLDN